MSRYEISGTNGNFNGLSYYYGLGNGDHKRKAFTKAVGMPMPFQPLLVAGTKKKPKMPFLPTADVFQQRAVQAEQKAEQFEERSEDAAARGQDSLSANLARQADMFESKAASDQSQAQKLRLPYANDPLMPRGLIQRADAAMVDTPVKVADQAAPLPPTEGVPVTAPTTTPAAIPTTLPLTPPPVLLPGMPMGYPSVSKMPASMPSAPPAMTPPPMGRPAFTLTPANKAAVAAALAASYFLFF